MMKKQIIALICCLGIFSSCTKFLDRNPYMSISATMALVDVRSADYALRGIYDRLQSTSAYGRILIVLGDAPTENVILSPTPSQRYISVTQWTVTPSTSEPSDTWSQTYRAINAANEILVRINNIDGTDDEIKLIRGEALALRGLLHFEMVRLFAQAYPGNESSLGVPYKENPDIYEKPARLDIRTVYSKILEDLSTAASLLNTTNTATYAPYRIDIWALKAVMARVYLAQLDYASAKPLLADIIANSGYKLLSTADYVGAWAKKYDAAQKTEFMFAIYHDNSDYGSTTSLGYIFLPEGYGDLRVPNSMLDIYNDNDVRKTAFFQAGTGAREGWTMMVKYPSRDGNNGLADDPIMRYSDVCLMYAEACAYTGDEATAITYLDMIRLRAEPEATPSTETGDALKEKIFLEIRKELAYEGHYLHDLKRYHKTIYGALNASGVWYDIINYPDTRLAYPIPQGEMDANENMVQNPGY